jgi:secreted Zn-dependent insulinase-like peptidase
VDTKAVYDGDTLGLVILVVTLAKPSLVLRSIREFLDAFSVRLRRMAKEEIKQYKDSAAARLLEAPPSLQAYAERSDDLLDVRQSHAACVTC